MTHRKNKKSKIPADNRTVSRDDLPARLVALRENPDLTDWEKVFCRSMGGKYSECGALTRGQYQAFCEVERNHSPEATQRRQQWIASWDAEKERIWTRMARYYEKTGHSNAFGNTRGSYAWGVPSGAGNPQYIPSEKQYKKVCENHHAQRLLALDKVPPRFQVGELAIMKTYDGLRLVAILEHDEVERPVAGARRVKVFFIHADASKGAMWTEESYLRCLRPELVAAIQTDFTYF